MANKYEGVPKLVRARRDRPWVQVSILLAVIAAMMIAGTWAYSVL